MSERVPTLGDVAQRAGVSPATVSRVVNGISPVRESTVEAVRAAIAELGYRPNLAARSLVTRRVGVIVVLVPETDDRVFTDPFFPSAYRGALEAFQGSRTHVLLSMAHPDEGIEPMLAYLASGQVDGAIVLAGHGSDFAEQVVAQPVPVVFVGDPEVPGQPFVDLDHWMGSRMLVDHVVAAGCRKVALLSGPLDMVAGRRRHDGFVAALAGHGLEPVAVHHGDFTRESACRAALELVDVDMDALLVASDPMAQVALEVLQEHGIDVPGGVRVTGFDDSAVARQTTPPLTTVSNDGRELSRRAGMVLRQILDGEQPDERTIIEPQLVVRESA